MLKAEKIRSIWGLSFFSWTITIIILSLIPDDGLVKLGVDNSGFRWDYIEHFIVYLLFAFLYLQWRKHDPMNKRIGLLLLVGILMATFTEVAQLFIQGRSFNYIDMACNFAGLPAGILSANIIGSLKPVAT